MGVASRVREWLAGPSTAKRDAALDALEAVAFQGRRGPVGGARVAVTPDMALRHSAVWAAQRLRANLISTLPIDGFRKVAGAQVEVPLPPFFSEPSGPGSLFLDWMWATQFDLDRYGMTAGVVTHRDGNRLPRTIELLPMGELVIRGKGWRITEVQHGRDRWVGEALDELYLEYQYRVAGIWKPLSPIAYAAWTISGYLAAQQFGTDYNGRQGHPGGLLRNTIRELPPENALSIKQAWKDAAGNGDIVVMGKDWEWTPADAPNAAAAFLESQRASTIDVARYLDVPADMIDGAVSGSSITYANITQRNVQLLVTSLGPAIIRREKRLGQLMSPGRFLKFNSDALLRMDPATREEALNKAIAARRLAPSEARGLDNRAPFTPEQLAEFDALFGTNSRALGVAETLQKAYLAVDKVITSDEARVLANAAGAQLPIPGPDFGHSEIDSGGLDEDLAG